MAQSPLLESAAHVLARLGALGVAARSLCADSRAVTAGDVFLAYPGALSDGRRYLADAARRGAAALLWEAEGGPTEPPAPLPGFAVPGLRQLSGPLAHLVYGRPSENLFMVGITGTNGKTSVSQWVAQCLSAAGRPCAVVGTLGSGYPDRLRDGLNTTPDAISLQRDLAGFVAEGAAACAMEASSIGIHQGRVDGVAFDVAVFTNLTQDHLDYHGSMEAYAEAKRALFERPDLKAAVINLDDPFGVELAQSLSGRGLHVIGYGLAASPVAVAESLVAEDIAFVGRGVRFTVAGTLVTAPVVGRFNVANLLALLGVLCAAGLSLTDAVPLLAGVRPPPGRMHTLGGVGQPLLVVDYAHTPDALENALATLRETARARGGRLTCVVGCGGDRDPGKRPLMGGIAARLADRVWITSDNPRSEDPEAIIAAILAGAPGAHSQPDRALAIAAAVTEAAGEDVVLLAGKGHETYQEIRGQRLPFSDIDQAQRALAAWNSKS